jgi:A/G-specific adenine glycosylase
MKIAVTRSIRNAFRGELTEWYRVNHRRLPWRETVDPYAIAVSEFMLQQTQVATALPYYGRWLARFPDWGALAGAEETAVLKAWEGLGYYARARNLQRLARAVAASPGGELPEGVAELEALPGIGPYTARAIASLAFGRRAGVLDGNVIRVLTRVFAVGEDIGRAATKERLWSLVEDLAPETGSGLFNQAIMELGALVCLPRNPRCGVCPLARVCQGRVAGPELFPVKRRLKTERRRERIALIRIGSKWWCERSSANGRLRGLWRFPEFDGATMRGGPVLWRLNYSITKYRVAMAVVRAEWKKKAAGNGHGRWLDRAEMERLPFAAAHRKVAGQLKSTPACTRQQR